MSIWIFDKLCRGIAGADLCLRRVAVILLLLSLGGCVGLPGGGGSDPPVRRVALYDGAVVVAGPPGYCIDPRSSTRRGAARFVLLASCASLGAAPGPAVDPAVITVSVLPRDANVAPPVAAQIAASLAPARALRQIDAGGVSLVHMVNGGDQVVPGGDPRYWRAGLVIDGHLVGLAAYTEVGGALAGTAGQYVLTETARIMQKLSAGG